MAASFNRLIAAAAVALALASCAKVENEEPASNRAFHGPCQIAIGETPTRALLGSDDRGRFGLWENGDKMGTFVFGSSQTPEHGAGEITPGSPSVFKVYSGSGFNGEETVRAYYPYDKNTTGPDAVSFTIPVLQTQTSSGFDFDAMPLVSGETVISAPSSDVNTPVGELYFANLGAMAGFRIFSTDSRYASEAIESVKFEASSPLAGSFTANINSMDIFDESTLVISGYSEASVTTTVSPAVSAGSSLESAGYVYMVVAPGTYSGSIVITTDKAIYRYSLSSSQTFKRSVVRVLGVNLATCSDRTSIGGETPITVTKTMSQIFSGMGISPTNATKYEILKLDDVITIETNGYNNCGNYYTSGANWRVYAADYGNVKIKAAPGYELRSVTLVYSSVAGTGNVYPTFDGPSSGQALAVSGGSVVFHIGNKLGHLRFTKFSVTYVASDYVAPRAYLDCYEMPAVTGVTVTSTGLETFGDDESIAARWVEYDLQESDRKVITHTYRYNGSVSRNYTTMMDKNKRCPLWVAYPMHGVAYVNNGVERVGSFNDKSSYDPAIPASWQSSGSTKDGSSSSPYSRGHLCASEDRQTTDDANRQTFYYTNQAPQYQNSFNSGVWSSLEGAIQSSAAYLTGRDTLYVVSGTLYENPNTGDSNDGGTVARPSHFYKLLMKCHFNDSGRMESAVGAAYVFTNQAHSGESYNNTKFKTSIDAIEERTGFDFFAAVPADLQATAESKFNYVL